jgi:hypothetical protein
VDLAFDDNGPVEPVVRDRTEDPVSLLIEREHAGGVATLLPGRLKDGLSAFRSLDQVAEAVHHHLDRRTTAAFGLPFVVYLLTLAPTIYNLDSAELTTAAATGGLVRATGYPLYLLLGRIWSWLPLGDVGYRLNLFSAFCGALTVALAERGLRRLDVSPWAALGALGLLATAPYFWALSLIAEVYTLHTALMAALLLLLLRWADNPSPQRLALVGLVGGLSAGNHAATVLLIPGCLWYVLAVAPRQALAPRSLLAALGASLLGLGVYLYLPLRYVTAPALNYAGHYDATGTFVPVDLSTLHGLWWLVSGQSFAGGMFAYRGAAVWREVLHFASELWRAFFAIGLGPGLLGLGVMLRRERRLGVALILMFVANAGFYINYRVVDKDTMFLPAYLIWALWLGVGLEWLLDWANRRGEARTQSWGMAMLRGVAIIAVFVAAAWNWRLVDLSSDRSARQRGEDILGHVEPGALVVGWWDTVPVIEYLQLVEGRRPDVQAINRFLISSDDLRQLVENEIARRPVYIDDPPIPWLRTFQARPAGPVYRLEIRKLRGTDS